MPSFPQLNPLRLRSYILRLPLCTRLLLTVCVALWVAAIPFPWLRDWASLEPDKMDFTQSRLFSFIWGEWVSKEGKHGECEDCGSLALRSRGSAFETTTVFGIERPPKTAWDQDICFGLWFQEELVHSANTWPFRSAPPKRLPPNAP
jgi:hypothetical protein